ncbi:hypothetical protein [Streptomyces lavendulocolor]|uniref:hypothetical protein n=1 Tax=Streptomyces lavendulocolor TaxID=67316 RepID=UPI003411B743
MPDPHDDQGCAGSPLLAVRVGHTDVKTTKKWYAKPDAADLPPAEAWCGLAGGG